MTHRLALYGRLRNRGRHVPPRPFLDLFPYRYRALSTEEIAVLDTMDVVAESFCPELIRRAWYIQIEGREPVKLLDWLKVHHAPTKELWSEKAT